MSLTHSQLLEVAKSHIPSAIALWPDRVGAERQWHRLAVEPDHDVWAIAWPSYSSTGLHDHDGSQGVICPVWGYLIENRWDGAKREMRLGKAGVEPIHESTVHDVISLGSSLTVHAYSPPLKKMRYYEHEVALDSRGKRRQAVLFLREEMV